METVTDAPVDDKATILDVLADAFEARVERQQIGAMGVTRFCREVLGVRLWRRQRDVARLIESGAREVAVKTGHGVGKTFLGGALVCYWLAVLGPGTTIVTSAPTNRQVEELLWREVLGLWLRSPLLCALGAPMRRNIRLAPDWAAYGFSTREPQRFQGWHAPRLRFLIDEANGFPESIWQAIDACLTGGDQQLVMFGNPIVASGRFYRACSDSHVARLTIGSREHPNVKSDRELIPGSVTREWIADFERRYAGSPQIIGSRIDGEFPAEGSPCAMVAPEWLRAARDVPANTTHPVIYAVDVARYGDNFTVVTRLEGQRVVWQRQWGRAGTVKTTDRLRALSPADWYIVDDTGVGGGVTDQLAAAGLPVVPFVGGEKAIDDARFVNRVAESWWVTREALEAGLMRLELPEAELDQQLTVREYQVRADRRIALESKVDYCKRTGLPSPDHADSLTMGVWLLVQEWARMASEEHYNLNRGLEPARRLP